MHVRLRYSRLPPVEASPRPPTPLAAEILAMVVRPLATATHLHHSDLATTILLQLSTHILAPTLTDQVQSQ